MSAQPAEGQVVRIEQTDQGTWVRVLSDGSRSTPYGSREAAEGKVRGDKPTASEQLVHLAEDRYSFGVSEEGDPFAIARGGPYIARMLRGGGQSLRAELAAGFVNKTGKVPSASALADAMTVLEGQAQDQDPTPLHLRVAPAGRGLLLDLGRPDGTVVEVTDEGWESYRPYSGPLFRRTKLTAPLPEPAEEGDLEHLWRLVNVTPRDRPLLLGWLVAALLPDIPHPIALLTGEQGTGKTTAGRLLVGLVDPSAVPLRTGPRDEQAWGVAAAASWVVGIDNVSTISAWLSDAMCRAVTGDGVISRELYTNGEVHLLAFQRVLLLTSIDAGALRGDLAERLLTIELERIPPNLRRTDRDLAAEADEAHAAILTGLLDLTAQVLAELPHARGRLTERPRMADFAEVLAAVDIVRGTDSFGDYMRAADRLSRDVVDNDPVGAAVMELLTHQPHWRGPAKVLLEELTRLSAAGVKGWPSSPRALAGRLKALAPALRANGVQVDDGRSHGARFFTLERTKEDQP